MLLTTPKKLIRILAAAIGCFAVLNAFSARAGTSAALTTPAAVPAPTIYDQIWGAATIYKNNDNSILEQFDLTGRFQLDYFNVDSSRGDNDFLEIRRFRLGFDSWWLDRHVELKATVDTALETFNARQVFYNRMTDLFVNFHLSDAVNIRLGKFEPHFGFDREYSDNLQKFFERSFFDDQVFNSGNDYLAGASVLGKIGKWGYQVAMFSNNVDRELGQFCGGQSYLGEISYDFAETLGADKALWAFDYLHSEPNRRASAFNTVRDAAATYFDYQKGRLGIVTQIGYAHGIAAKGELIHFQVMPTYMLTKKLELISRFEFGNSSEDNGITTAVNREERTVGRFTGRTQHAEYVGLNYYVYGQKLKLMIGEQYSDLSGGTGAAAGFRGWTTLAGFRLFF